MPANLIVFQSKKKLKIKDDRNSHVQINLIQNPDGTNTAKLLITCNLDPSSFRIVPQTGLNPDGSPKFALTPGEFGYYPNTEIHAGQFQGDQFIISPGAADAVPLNVTILLGDPKIDYGNII